MEAIRELLCALRHRFATVLSQLAHAATAVLSRVCGGAVGAASLTRNSCDATRCACCSLLRCCEIAVPCASECREQWTTNRVPGIDLQQARSQRSPDSLRPLAHRAICAKLSPPQGCVMQHWAPAAKERHVHCRERELTARHAGPGFDRTELLCSVQCTPMTHSHKQPLQDLRESETDLPFPLRAGFLDHCTAAVMLLSSDLPQRIRARGPPQLAARQNGFAVSVSRRAAACCVCKCCARRPHECAGPRGRRNPRSPLWSRHVLTAMPWLASLRTTMCRCVNAKRIDCG